MFWFQDEYDEAYDDMLYAMDEEDEELLELEDKEAAYFDVEPRYVSINIRTGREYRF